MVAEEVVHMVVVGMVNIAVLAVVMVVHQIMHHIKTIQEKKISIKNLKTKLYLLTNYLYAPMRSFFFLCCITFYS